MARFEVVGNLWRLWATSQEYYLIFRQVTNPNRIHNSPLARRAPAGRCGPLWRSIAPPVCGTYVGRGWAGLDWRKSTSIGRFFAFAVATCGRRLFVRRGGPRGVEATTSRGGQWLCGGSCAGVRWRCDKEDKHQENPAVYYFL